MHPEPPSAHRVQKPPHPVQRVINHP
jgi:hypothetical protein